MPKTPTRAAEPTEPTRPTGRNGPTEPPVIRARRRRRRLAWGILLLAAVLICFLGSTRREMSGTATFYAVVSRQIAETGHLAPLMHGDAPYVLKPPLLFWLTALSYDVFGNSTFAATFFSRFFGVLVVALTGRLAWRLFGPATGWFAALLIATNVTLMENTVTFRMETALLVGILVSMLAYLGRGRWWRPPLFYLGITIGVLAKGPPGLLPLVLAPLHALIAGRGRGQGRGRARARWTAGIRPWAAWSTILLVPIAWYAYNYVLLGSMLVENLVDDTMVGTKPPLEHLLSVLHNYGWNPLVRFLPWSPLMIAGAAIALRDVRCTISPTRRATLVTLLVWIVLIFVVVAIKPFHRVRYLIPALVPLCILGGRELARIFRARVPVAFPAALGVASVIAVVVLAAFPVRLPDDYLDEIAEMRRTFDAELPAPSSPVPLLTPRWKRPPGMGAEWREMDWSLFYLDRPIVFTDPDAVLDGGPPGRHYLVFHTELDELRERLPLREVTRGAVMVLVRSGAGPGDAGSAAPAPLSGG